ncbi:MAG TPA: sulfotransferase [Pirellulales bacterium]|jgi:tetratricopeptide (TPR) repeat protein|nr:sulfotransferase [Pirellulales bacterium]
MTTARPTPPDAEFDALIALADREQGAGRLAEAAAAYRQIIALRPELAEAYSNLGDVLLDQGQCDEAAAQYVRAIALKPGLFAAHNNLGCILRQQGQLDQAAARFRQAIAIMPDLAQAYNNLGGVLLDQDKLDEAAAQYEKALALEPDLFQAHNDLACVLQQQGQLDRAIGHFRRSLMLAPNVADTHFNLAGALKAQGKFRDAEASYNRALVLDPDYAEAHYDRTDLKTFRAGDYDLAALERLAAAKRLPPAKMLYIHFALGKALQDVGDYPKAFEHLLRANSLRRGQVDYDEAATRQTFRLVAEVFDAALLKRFQGAGNPSPAPIFIVGMPRSGTTLVEQILASHPQVRGAGELKNLDRVVRSVAEAAGRPDPFSSGVWQLSPESLRRLGQTYLASLPKLADGKTRITDKAPGNFLHIGLIRLILPHARIVHTTRDPVDTCVSCFSKLLKSVPFSHDLGELGRYYCCYSELMAHWRTVLPAGAMLEVAYRDVVDDLEMQARRLVDYCGLPWDDHCLRFHETERPVATASNVQVRRPLYRSAFERWRPYEAYLEPLLTELNRCRQP